MIKHCDNFGFLRSFEALVDRDKQLTATAKAAARAVALCLIIPRAVFMSDSKYKQSVRSWHSFVMRPGGMMYIYRRLSSGSKSPSSTPESARKTFLEPTQRKHTTQVIRGWSAEVSPELHQEEIRQIVVTSDSFWGAGSHQRSHAVSLTC